MPGSTLNRFIFWELARVFLLALATITGLLAAAGLAQQAAQMGLSLGQVLQAIPLFVPNTLPYTIPATTLFATCVVYGRLAHDNEVVAVRAAGVHLVHLLKPALLVGALASAGTAALYHTTIPRSQQLLYQLLAANPEEVVYNLLRRDRCVRHPNLGYVLYVRDVQGKRLLDVVLKRRTKARDGRTGQESYPGGYDVVTRAPEARLRVDPADGCLYLEPKRFAIHDKNTSGEAGRTGPFQMTLPDGLNGRDNRVRPGALTWDDIPAHLAALREEAAAADRRRRERQEAAAALENPDLRQLSAEEDRHFRYQVEFTRRMVRNVETELYLRPALACACLLFAVLGCPVGIWANRADYLSTFVVCFLPVVLLYYPLLFAGTGMGKDGKVPLPVGCWAANLALAAVAVVLNVRLLRR